MPFYSRLLPRTEIVHNCLFRSLPTPLLPRHLPALFRRVHPCVSVALRILGNCSLRRAGSTSAAGDRDVGSGRCSRRLFRQLLPALLYLRHPCRRPTPLYLPRPWGRTSSIPGVVLPRGTCASLGRSSRRGPTSSIPGVVRFVKATPPSGGRCSHAAGCPRVKRCNTCRTRSGAWSCAGA